MTRAKAMKTLTRDQYTEFKALCGPIHPGLVYPLVFPGDYLFNKAGKAQLVSYYTKSMLTAEVGKEINPGDALKAVEAALGITATLAEKNGTQKATIVTSVSLPLQFQAFRSKVLAALPDGECLVRMTGKKAGQRKELRAESISQIREERKSDLVNLLNECRNYHASGQKVLPTILQQITQDYNQGLLSDGQYQNLKLVLKGLSTDTQPIYQQVSQSPRIYTRGVSIVNLSRKYRKLYCQEMGWHTFDLSSAQFLIALKVLSIDCSDWVERIMAGESLWEIIQSEMKVQVPKDLLKTSIYSMLFGASVERDTANSIKRLWTDSGYGNVRSLFLSIPNIKKLWEARTAHLRAISAKSHIVDVFGETQYLKGAHTASLMAWEIQAYEMALIQPLLEHVFSLEKFNVALHLHDGFSITTRSEDLVPGLFNKLQSILSARAAELGVSAKLTWETKPVPAQMAA